MKKAQSKDLLSAEQLAERWGMSSGTLENWRAKKKGPNFLRIGGAKGSLIYYRMADVLAYEDKCLVKTKVSR